jgi:hypothetical protein
VPRQDTVRSVIAPVVLVIGGPEDLFAACADIARSLEAEALPVIPERAAQVAAEYRPFAIVLLDEIYEREPLEHEALARDVGARIVRVSEKGIPVEALEALLRGTLLEALWRQAD